MEKLHSTDNTGMDPNSGQENLWCLSVVCTQGGELTLRHEPQLLHTQDGNRGLVKGSN
jgi:hypothetical protein